MNRKAMTASLAILGAIVLSAPAMAGKIEVLPAFNGCKAECNKVKASDLKYCLKQEGDIRSRCKEAAERDYDVCFAQCEKKYTKRK